MEGGFVQTFHGTGTLTYASDSAIGEDSDAILTGSVVVSVPGMDDDSYSEDLDIKVCTSCKYNFDVKNIRTKIIVTRIIYGICIGWHWPKLTLNCYIFLIFYYY